MSKALDDILAVLNEEALANAEAVNAKLRADMESKVVDAEANLLRAEAATLHANQRRDSLKATLNEVANDLDDFATRLRQAVMGLK